MHNSSDNKKTLMHNKDSSDYNQNDDLAVESIKSEVNNASLERSDLESDKVKLSKDKSDDVKSNKFKANKFKANKFKANKFKANKFKANKFKANKFKANKFKGDDTELNSIKSDSTKLFAASMTVDHSPKAAHVTTGNSMTPISRLTKTPKMIANGSRAFVWYALALVVLVFDQFTKWLAETNLTFNEPVPVIEPFLNWTLAYNYGAAFSFLADAGGWQKWFFSGLALVMSIFLTIYLLKAPRQAKLLSLGLALVLGGAVGNLIDRLLHGHVIDFIHVHNADVWHYPIFNIADMGISVGVAMIVIDMIFLEKRRQI